MRVKSPLPHTTRHSLAGGNPEPGDKRERGIIAHLRNQRNQRFRRHRPFRKAKGAQATDTSPNDRKQSAGDAPGGGAGCGIPSPLMGEG